jgi:hypothetical protein
VPALSSPAWLFTVLGGISSLPTAELRAPRPLCYVSFLLLLLIIRGFFLSSLGGSVCPGGYADLAQSCLWKYHIPLSSPCGLRLPQLSRCWHLVAVREPSWFLHLA